MAILLQTPSLPLRAHHHRLKLMGCGFALTAVHADKQLAWDAIRAGVSEIQRIEAVISSWQPSSFTSKVNALAGREAVWVPLELFELIARSIKISALTHGAFDISGTLARDYWQFDRGIHAWPSDAQIAELRERIDYTAIELDRAQQTVFLRKEGMKIGFGGIGKGYAALQAHKVMAAMGIENGLVDASGDLMAWGRPPRKEHWEIHLRHPEDRNRSLLSIAIPHGSVVTSGNSEHYSIVEGRKLSHIVDPRTGLPVEALHSVSVTCPDPEIADALATAISVLGAQEGIALVDQLKGVEAIAIDQDHHIYLSKHFKG